MHRGRGGRGTATLWALAIVAGLALITGPGSPEAIAARPLVTGVSYVAEDEPPVFRQVREAGGSFVHRWLRWASVAPALEPADWSPADPADRNYEWAPIDRWVEDAVAAGLTPLLQIYGVPSWAQGCAVPGAPAAVPCRPDPTKLAQFARAAAARYSGRFAGLPQVRYWQGLNEPNLSLYFDPQFEAGRPVSPGLYRRLLNAFYGAVKSVDRSDLVLAAGLGPIAVPGATIGPMRFARLLLCMRGRRDPHPTAGGCRGGVHLDIFDIHPYTSGGPTHRGGPDDLELGDLGKLRELIRAADRAGRIEGAFHRTPLWVTEFSWDSKPPDPGGLAMPILERWTAEALYRAWLAGIDHFFWNRLRDEPPSSLPFSQTLQSGLYFRGATVAEDRPKPSMYAFRFPLVAFSRAGGFSFWGRTPSSRGGAVAIQVRRSGGWRLATVVRAGRGGVFEGAFNGPYGDHDRGAVRAVYRGERSVPFSLRPVPDFHQPPFGRPTAR